MTLAHKMNLKVIAEGIETARQAERLLELGCEYGQGYYFSQPWRRKRHSVHEAAVAPKRERRHRRMQREVEHRNYLSRAVSWGNHSSIFGGATETIEHAARLRAKYC